MSCVADLRDDEGTAENSETVIGAMVTEFYDTNIRSSCLAMINMEGGEEWKSQSREIKWARIFFDQEERVDKQLKME